MRNAPRKKAFFSPKNVRRGPLALRPRPTGKPGAEGSLQYERRSGSLDKIGGPV